jgi:hypothetical protein
VIIVAYLIIFCKVTLSTCDSVWYKLVLVMLVTLSRSILWWRLFQKLVALIDIYVFIVNIGMTDTKSFSPLFINVLHFNLLINHWTIEIFARMICKFGTFCTLNTFLISFQTVNSIQHYVIKFVSNLRQIGGVLRVPLFPPPIKLTATIYLKYYWTWH